LSYTASDLCIVFVPDESYISILKGLGYKRIHYLPFATNPTVFSPVELTTEERGRFACEISFVGNPLFSYLSIYQNFCKDKLSGKEAQAIIEETIKIQSQNPLLNISDVLNEVQKAHQYILSFEDSNHRFEIEALLEQVAMCMYRKEILKSVSHLDLHVYGGEGWKEVMNGEGKYLGPINNRTELPLLYKASKINLNITTSQQRSGLPMRVFDIGGCGGFMLTDYRHDLGRLFNLGEEAIYYKDKDDLRKKVEYFLSNPDEADEIAQRFHKKVLRKHTYKIRMQEIVEAVRGEGFSLKAT